MISPIDNVLNTKFIIIATIATATSNYEFALVDFALGQPLHVIFAAFVGCFVGVWNKDFPNRKELLKAFLTSIVITVGAIVVIPEWSGYEWPNANYQAAVAMLLGFTSQTWGPRLSDYLMDRFFKKEKDRE